MEIKRTPAGVYNRNQNSKIRAPGFVNTERYKSNPPEYLPNTVKNTKESLLDILNFKNIELDPDRSVILMILLMLTGKDRENDDLLIMALMYIML